MNGRKQLKISHGSVKDFLVQPKAFIFIDKGTGTQRFEVKADAHGKMPVDEAVSLLVVHCLMRNQTPNDFEIMVSASENLLEGLGRRTRKLIQSSPSFRASLQLTGRQQEVFRGVQQALSNKEIGKKLNLSVRTVKFHISSLLQKFNVAGRMGLMRKTAVVLVVNGSVEAKLPPIGDRKDSVTEPASRVSRESLHHLHALDRRSRV